MLKNLMILFSGVAILMVMLITCNAGQNAPTMEQFNQLKQRVDDLDGKSFTIYGIDGKPYSQGQDQKGLHFVYGTTKLQSLGRSLVNLNTASDGDVSNVSFKSKNSYSGFASPLTLLTDDMVLYKTYHIYPKSGNQFYVTSSHLNDTVTVNYMLVGE